MLPPISDRYNVFLDCKITDIICEYFDCRGINFGYVDCEEDVPLIDVILHRSDKSKAILLVISLQTLGRLITDKSPWNDPMELIKQGKIEIVLKNEWETLNCLYASVLHADHGVTINEKDIQDRNMVSKDTLEILRTIQLTCLVNDGIAGKNIREYFLNWRFVYIEQQHMKIMEYHNVFHLSKNDPRPRNKTFAFITRIQKSLRDHRKWAVNEMKDKKYITDAIITITDKEFDSKSNNKKDVPENDYVLDDYKGQYGDTWLKSDVRLHYAPCPKYYLNTNFEVVCETLGQHPTDNSFFLSEKTLKPIIMKHPFIMIAPMHHIKNLREMGFKTFDGLIDESYDNIENVHERIKTVGRLLEDMTIERSRRLYEESRDICEFNQDHLLNLHGRYKFDLWNNLEDFFSTY